MKRKLQLSRLVSLCTKYRHNYYEEARVIMFFLFYTKKLVLLLPCTSKDMIVYIIFYLVNLAAAVNYLIILGTFTSSTASCSSVINFTKCTSRLKASEEY